jgi:hypothetical protein
MPSETTIRFGSPRTSGPGTVGSQLTGLLWHRSVSEGAVFDIPARSSICSFCSTPNHGTAESFAQGAFYNSLENENDAAQAAALYSCYDCNRLDLSPHFYGTASVLTLSSYSLAKTSLTTNGYANNALLAVNLAEFFDWSDTAEYAASVKPWLTADAAPDGFRVQCEGSVEALLLSGLLSRSDEQEADCWRQAVLDTLNAWYKNTEASSQRQFWRLFDFVDAGGIVDAYLPALKAAPDFTLHEAAHLWLGQSKWQADLSFRTVRSILKALIEKLHDVDRVADAGAIIKAVRESLARGVLRRVRWRHVCVRRRGLEFEPSAHDSVLDFIVHTGISPPGLAASHPAARWVLFAPAARKVAYETICRRETRRDLSHVLRGGTAKTRRHPRPRSRPSFGRVAQPAGRRHHRPNYSLEKFA